MTTQKISNGTVHKLPDDLKKALSASQKALYVWEDITPLARNEWICWTTSVKSPEIRKQHVTRVVADLVKGKRRPCCWIGCIHRTDKGLSPSQKYILNNRSKGNHR